MKPIGISLYPIGVSRHTRPCLLENVFLFTVLLERKSGITGVPFGRTDLSIGANGTTFHTLLHRHVSLGFKGCPKSVFFMLFFKNVL